MSSSGVWGAHVLVLNDTVPNQVVGDWLDIDNGKQKSGAYQSRRLEWRITKSVLGIPTTHES